MPAYVITQRISFSGTNIDFPLSRNTHQLDDFDDIIHKDKSGGTVIYKRAGQIEWDVDVICTKTEADTNIRSWISGREQVVYTEDFVGAPGTTHNTRIINAGFPMVPWGEGKWRGTLRLRKEA